MFVLFTDLFVGTIAFALLMVVVSIGGSAAAFTLICLAGSHGLRGPGGQAVAAQACQAQGATPVLFRTRGDIARKRGSDSGPFPQYQVTCIG